jgi:hypothetical protein
MAVTYGDRHSVTFVVTRAPNAESVLVKLLVYE